MHRFVVSVRIQPGSADEVRAILAEGPPFDLAETRLERHEVFLSNGELTFVFEGPGADEEASRLLATPSVLGQASRLGAHFDGAPRVPEEVFSWERPEEIEGLTWGPQPGPGDSDGGDSD